MTTPDEDRITALEALAAQQGSALSALQKAGAALAVRTAALEAEYSDAVQRYQRADVLMHRTARLLRAVRSVSGPALDNDLARLPEDQRTAYAQQREADDAQDSGL